MNPGSRYPVALCLLFASCGSILLAQSPASDPFASIGSTTAGTKSYESQGAVLILTVFGEKHALLDRQAVVKLENKNTHSVLWQTTADKSEAYFVDLSVGQYDIETSAVGYLTVH